MKKTKNALIVKLIIAVIISSTLYSVIQFLYVPTAILSIISVAIINAILLFIALAVYFEKYHPVLLFVALILISTVVLLFSIIDNYNYLYFFMLSLPMVVSSYLLNQFGFITLSLYNMSSIAILTYIFNKFYFKDTLSPLSLLFILFAIIFFFIKYRWHIEEESDQIITETFDSSLYILAYQAEIRHHETGRHLERVSAYVKILVKELLKSNIFKDQLSHKFKSEMVQASILHDIGKVGVPDSILLKPGKLTPQEYTRVKEHCLLGTMILNKAKECISSSSLSDLAVQIIRSHHEKWDGTGYPDGLIGHTIPLSARIVAIADVYDALRSRRPYKESLTHEECCQIIRDESGKHFDPHLVEAFSRVEQKFLKISQNDILTRKIIVKSFKNGITAFSSQ